MMPNPQVSTSLGTYQHSGGSTADPSARGRKEGHMTFEEYRELILEATPYEREHILEDAEADLGWRETAKLACVAAREP